MSSELFHFICLPIGIGRMSRFFDRKSCPLKLSGGQQIYIAEGSDRMYSASIRRKTACSHMGAFLSILISGVIISGCGGGAEKEGLVSAYGTVTLDGEPLPFAQIMFKHVTDGTSIGRTDGSGYFNMQYTLSQSGAFAGENVVYFSTKDMETDDGTVQKNELVPKQYREGTSTLKVTVKEGDAPYDFELKSK